MQYTRRLFTLVALLCVSTMMVQAQQPSVPTPAVGTGNGSSNVPTIETTPAAPTPEGTQEPSAETDAETETTTVPDTTTGSLPTLPETLGQTCPSQVDYQVVPTICSGLVTDEACIAQGTVSASQRIEDANFSFSLPGHRTRLSELSELSLESLSTESAAWSVVVANLPLNTNDPNLSAPAVVSMLLIGDVRVANASVPTAATTRTQTASAKVLGTAGINVRRSPSGSAAAVYQLAPGATITATGRLDNNEGRWIRIIIPNEYQGVGWVIGDYVQVEGDADNLRAVLEGVPIPTAIPSETGSQVIELGPMQAMNLVSRPTDRSCSGIPDSGLLVQTPNGIASGSGAKMRVNGVDIVLNGTAFIEAQQNVSLRVTVLEGEVSVTANGSTVQAQAISQVAVTMGQTLEPINAPNTVRPDTAKIEALPVDLLDRSFLLDESLITTDSTTTETGQGGSLTASGEESDTTEPTAETGGISNTAAQPTALPTCTLSAGPQARNIRVSPDINASVAGVVDAGSSVQSSNVVRDAKFSNVYWYEVDRGFMRYDSVLPSEGCQALLDAVLPTAIRPTVEPTVGPTLDPLATVQPEITATVGAPATGTSLTSSEKGEACATPEGLSLSVTAVEGAVDVAVGGTWTVNRGGDVRITVEGINTVRNDYGDVFRVVDVATNQVLVHSEVNAQKFLAFPSGATFQIRVAPNPGDLALLRVTCR